MNRRLFWKIFLPFWVAQALLLGVLYMRLHYPPALRESVVGAAGAAPGADARGSGGPSTTKRQASPLCDALLDQIVDAPPF